MSVEELTALRIASGSRSVTAGEMLITSAKAGGLVRRGLLRSYSNSELVRGERRLHYKEYRITDYGRDLI